MVHTPFVLASGVVRDEKLCAACSAALRILAVMRRFRDRESGGAQNFPRLLGDPPASGQVARIMVGCRRSGRYDRKLRQQFRDQFRMVQDAHAQFLIRRDLTVILVEHCRAVRAARYDVLYPRVCECFDELLRKLQEKVFVPRAPRGLTAASFPSQHSPGNSGCFENLFHRQGYRLPVWIETQSTPQPEQPFLLSVENRKLIRLDQFLPSILSDAPGIVRSPFHGRKQLDHFAVRNAALAYESPAKVENFSSHMLDADGTYVLARAAG